MLKIILPTGSLNDAVRNCLTSGGYDVPLPNRCGVCGIVNGVEFHQLDRRSIPDFIVTGEYDAGITGRDLLIASGVQGLTEVCALTFSRSSSQPTRWVLAQRQGFQLEADKEVLIGCELPHFAEEILQKVELPFRYRVVPIYGSEEQGTRFRLKGTDMVVVVTESGDSLRANDLEMVRGCGHLFESTPVIIARPSLDEDSARRLKYLSAALRCALGARRMVMVMSDLPTSVNVQSLDLPASVAPTVSLLTQVGWCAYSICIPVSEQGRVASILEENGARGIVMIPVQGYLA